MVNKKAISPVVATALLLVVAVVAVVGFQTWFNTYQSGLNTQVEQQSATGTAILIERLETSTLYLKNSGATDIVVSSVTVDGTDCTTLGSFNATPGVSSHALTDCNATAEDVVDVVVVTADGVFSESEIVR